MGHYSFLSDSLKPKVIEAVKGAVKSERAPEPWAAAVEGLGTLSRNDAGPLVLIALERALDENAAFVVRACAEVLGDLAYRQAGPTLVRASDRVRDNYAQRALLRAMGRVGGKESAERLRVALSSATDPFDREVAATALGDVGGSLAAEALRDTVLRAEEQIRVRRAAIVALEKIGGLPTGRDEAARAIDACLKSVRDKPDESSRTLARELQAVLERLRRR
jgi:HEAT repeat protein